MLQAIELNSIVVKDLPLLIGRQVLHAFLVHTDQSAVVAVHLIDWEVASKHAAIDAKAADHMVDVRLERFHSHLMVRHCKS